MLDDPDLVRVDLLHQQDLQPIHEVTEDSLDRGRVSLGSLKSCDLHHAPFHLFGFSSPHVFTDSALKLAQFFPVLRYAAQASANNHLQLSVV